jgi:splicing factor 3A subunit 1
MGREDAVLMERVHGVINPPPEIKKIIDKAASLVAKYGSNMDSLLRSENLNLPKFAFLKPGDPYRAYYDQVVNELSKQSDGMKKEADTILLGRKKEAENDILNEINREMSLQKKKSLVRDEVKELVEILKKEKDLDNKVLPQDQYILVHPNISPLDMYVCTNIRDIIKTTAQFVARNGQRFLTGLSEREAKNSQFDFLKPQHNLFGYFTLLVEQYSKCLSQKKEEISKLTQYSSDRQFVIRKCCERYLLEKRLKESQKKRNNLDENEKNQMAQIDWYDFVIVETVEFTEEELKNTVSVHPNDYNANADINSMESNVESLMKEVDKEKVENKELVQPLVIPTLPRVAIENYNKPEPGMKIVKNYVRKVESKTTTTSKCPLCNENINTDDLLEHMRIELLDPKWREINKELTERKNFSTTNSDELLGYLNEFSQNRPDLFGDVSDVVKVEKKETNVQNVIWDGFAPNMTRTTANIAMLHAQTKKNIEETRRIRESATPTLVINPTPSTISTQPQTTTKPQPSVTLPSKIPIPIEKGLLSEEAWIKKYPNNINVNVKLPEGGEESWGLKGQIITISHNVKDSIAAVKQNLSKQLKGKGTLKSGIPTSAMRIKLYSGEDTKDDKILAFYNIKNNDFIEVELNTDN